MTIEVESKLLEDFLNKLTLKKTVGSCIINTTEKGMVSQIMTTDNLVITKVIAPASMFVKYKPGMKITLGQVDKISDVKLLGNTLTNFSGKVKLEVDETHLHLDNEDNFASIIMVAEEFIDNNMTKMLTPTTAFDKGFVLSKKFLDKTSSNVETLKTNDDTPRVLIEVKNKICYCIVEKDGNKLGAKVPVEYKDCKIKLNGAYFSQIVGVIDDKATLSFTTDDLVKITEKTDKLGAMFIIAPIVENAEEEAEEEEPDEDKPKKDVKKTPKKKEEKEETPVEELSDDIFE